MKTAVEQFGADFIATEVAHRVEEGHTHSWGLVRDTWRRIMLGEAPESITGMVLWLHGILEEDANIPENERITTPQLQKVVR